MEGNALENLWRTRHQTSSIPEKTCSILKAHLFSRLFYLLTEYKPTSRCSLQILHSHTARGRLLHCVPHLVHIFYGIWEDICISQVDSSWYMTFCVFQIVWSAAEKCDWLTFLQSSHTTELTLGEPNCSPHSKQWDMPSPHTVFFMSSRRFINRLQKHRVRVTPSVKCQSNATKLSPKSGIFIKYHKMNMVPAPHKHLSLLPLISPFCTCTFVTHWNFFQSLTQFFPAPWPPFSQHGQLHSL